MRDKQAYLQADAEHLSPALNRAFDIVAKKASGSFIYDMDDTAYLDMTSGIAVNQVGHAHPEVAQAVAEQAANCIHTSCVVHYPANIELAEKLASLMPGDISNTFFCNSGAESVDGAIKLIKILQPGRNNFIVHRGSFHGRTLGATSLTTSKAAYRKFYDPLVPGVHVVDFPNSYAAKTASERKAIEESMHENLEKMFATSVAPESVAAILIEPVLGEGGYIPAPFEYVNYLKHLREVCDKYGILLAFDEVQSGFMRTGKWFASEHYGVVPDIQLMAKGLSGGVPLGAFSSRKELMYKMPPGSHGSTWGGNPIACKASLKLIEIIERDNIQANVHARSEQIFNFFESKYPGSNTMKLTEDYKDTPVKVRGFGLMIGLEFKSAEFAQKVKQHALENNVLLLGCGTYGTVIRLAPDLTISEENTQRALDVIYEGVEKNYVSNN
ncbi:MAG: aminotransferase class III-fold pyridoxal phosphate-dependent enzyme [Candidatus Caenarcaniphilales bacterium]|nr:aminotransferase class III-fold pyridoxal phosphate-dependent enzyme [Candidatus Caenarcaniphilales bacterium]